MVIPVPIPFDSRSRAYAERREEDLVGRRHFNGHLAPYSRLWPHHR